MLIRKAVSMLISYCCGSVQGNTSVRAAAMAELGHICASNMPVGCLSSSMVTGEKITSNQTLINFVENSFLLCPRLV